MRDALASLTFGILNVLVGVFVADAAINVDPHVMIHAEMFRREQFVKEMREFFKDLGRMGVGGAKAAPSPLLSWEHFRDDLLASDELQAYLRAHQIDPTDAYMLFSLLDREGKGALNVHEFIYGCLKLRGTARSSEVRHLMEKSKEMMHCFIEMQKQKRSKAELTDLVRHLYIF